MKEDYKLIAEFMECWNSSYKTKHIGTNLPFLGNKWRDWGDMKFDSSWDWLMPVVEKIAENYDFTIQFYAGDCNCYCMKQTDSATDIPGIGHGGFKPNIESVYRSVVAFVKWYAKNKPLKY